jgi:hypothetical protein
MTLLTAHGSGGRTFDVFAQDIIDRAEDLSGFRVMAGLEFFGLLGMARTARLRRDHHLLPIAPPSLVLGLLKVIVQ